MRNMKLLGLVLAVVMTLVGGGVRDATASHPAWTTTPDAFGCTYYWDGYRYSMALCAMPYGIYRGWADVNGEWVYAADLYPAADGRVWIYTPQSGWYTFETSTMTTVVGGPGYNSGSPGELTVHDVITDITRRTCQSGEYQIPEACS